MKLDLSDYQGAHLAVVSPDDAQAENARIIGVRKFLEDPLSYWKPGDRVFAVVARSMQDAAYDVLSDAIRQVAKVASVNPDDAMNLERIVLGWTRKAIPSENTFPDIDFDHELVYDVRTPIVLSNAE